MTKTNNRCDCAGLSARIVQDLGIDRFPVKDENVSRKKRRKSEGRDLSL